MSFQNYKLANNAKTTFAAPGVLAGGTSFTCATGEGARFPTTFPFFLTLEKIVAGIITKREVTLCTNRVGDVFTITRSAGYCPASASATTQTNTAFAFDVGDTISLRIVAENIDDINAELVRLGLVLYPDASTTVKGLSKLTVPPTRTIGTATMTIANPCVVSKATHGLTADDAIKFTTTGALPTGIVASTVYYVSATGLTAGTFQVSATPGGASIITTGAQSGTHTLYCVTGFAVGDNDTRMPTQGENDALVGSYGTPGSANPFVTATDPLYANNVKTTGNQSVAGVKTFTDIPVLPASDATTANQAVRKAQVDAMFGISGKTDISTFRYRKIGSKTYFIYPVDAATTKWVGWSDGRSGSATNTLAKIASDLGITISSYGEYGATIGGTQLYEWTGSTWTTGINGCHIIDYVIAS